MRRQGGDGVWLTCHENGVFLIAGEENPMPLKFNPLTGLIEGEEDDTFRIPSPGEPVPKRSAMAVIIEHVLRRMTNR